MRRCAGEIVEDVAPRAALPGRRAARHVLRGRRRRAVPHVPGRPRPARGRVEQEHGRRAPPRTDRIAGRRRPCCGCRRSVAVTIRAVVVAVVQLDARAAGRAARSTVAACDRQCRSTCGACSGASVRSAGGRPRVPGAARRRSSASSCGRSRCTFVRRRVTLARPADPDPPGRTEALTCASSTVERRHDRCVDIGAWAVVHAGTGYAVHRLPADSPLIAGDRWLVAIRAGSSATAVASTQRVLRIKRWKDRVPEAGALFAGGVVEAALPGRGRRRLAAVRDRDPPGRARPLARGGRRPVLRAVEPAASAPCSCVVYGVGGQPAVHRDPALQPRCASSACSPVERGPARARATDAARSRSVSAWPGTNGQQHPVRLAAEPVVQHGARRAATRSSATRRRRSGEPAVDVDLVHEEVAGAVRGHSHADPEQRRDRGPIVAAANSATPNSEKQTREQVVAFEPPGGRRVVAAMPRASRTRASRSDG